MRLIRILLLLISLVTTAVTIYRTPVHAALATEEQMDKATKPLEEYMKDIKQNYDDIEGLLLMRNKGNLEEMIVIFQNSAKASVQPLDKAAYQYLTARGYYWQCINEFKAKRDRTIFDKARPKIIDSYLEAFVTINSIMLNDRRENIAEVSNLKGDILRSFAALLSNNIWGSKLTNDEKKKIEGGYLQVIEKNEEIKNRIPPSVLADIYARLGMSDRLDDRIPQELPDDYVKLLGILEKNIGVVPTEKLLPVAEKIEKNYAEKLEKDGHAQAMLAGIYKPADKEKALALYIKASKILSEYTLEVYIMALHGTMPEKEREQHLQDYLDSSYAPKSKYDIQEAYEYVAEKLLQAKEYKECLKIIDRAEKEKFKGSNECMGIYGVMYYRKGRCYEALGNKEEAYSAYCSFLSDIENDPRYRLNREEVGRRIAKLKIL